MFEIKKKKKSGVPSAGIVKDSAVPSTKINPGEFSAKANLASLKKSGPSSANKVAPSSFKGSESVKEEKLESANSAYIERMKKRAKK